MTGISPDAWTAFQAAFQVRQFCVSGNVANNFSISAGLVASSVLTKIEASQAKAATLAEQQVAVDAAPFTSL